MYESLLATRIKYTCHYVDILHIFLENFSIRNDTPNTLFDLISSIICYPHFHLTTCYAFYFHDVLNMTYNSKIIPLNSLYVSNKPQSYFIFATTNNYTHIHINGDPFVSTLRGNSCVLIFPF